MSCWEIIADYGLRSIGFGERLLPSSDFTICHQFTLIGSGMIWNIYFGILALASGFLLSIVLALGKASENTLRKNVSGWFIFIFRGSPLFIQFFFAYFAFVNLKSVFPIVTPLTSAWLGALIVLFCNTAAYSGEIFYGALKAIPRGDLEAADAFGLSGWHRFRRIIWPTMLRLGWPAYTNEAIFLFHATTLVYFSAFPTWQQRGDALYYARYFADKTFNPFVPYPILAAYFIVLTLIVIGLFGLINQHLNRHLPVVRRSKLSLRVNLIR